MKRVISILMAAVTMLTVAVTLAGCGEEEAIPYNEKLGEVGFHLVAEKVGNVDRGSFMTGKGGLYYKDESGKYGVMSLEGRYDTGAIYADCFEVDSYFSVSKTKPKDSTDIKALNSRGLINGKGETVVPFKYADFLVLNDRYIVVKTIDKATTDEEVTVVTYDKDFAPSTVISGKDYMYTGKWEVYDVENQKTLSGVGGKDKDASVNAKGNFVTYKTDNEWKTLDTNGKLIDENTNVFEDGSYLVKGETTCDVYSADGEKLFTCDLKDYVPEYAESKYFIARKQDENYKTTYAVMDKTGKIISKEYESSISVYGEFVLTDNKLYNFKGEQVVKNDVGSATEDKVFGECVVAHNNKAYIIIKSDGTVVYQGEFSDEISISSDNFLASKKTDDGYFYYSYKDKDYTIKGYDFAPWLVKTNGSEDLLYNIVDATTGKTLFEGYNEYSSSHEYYSAVFDENLSYYVYAKYDGGADVFLITNSTNLEDVQAKRANLLDDLVAAFEKEGLTVSVNKETGEMSLDSSVLFGGDSAELTADGKTFLNKFIKVYTEVAFSEKYAGFITKTMVEGHTAPLSDSTYESGLPLSQKRAENVKNYCLSKETGVDVSALADTLKDRGCSNSQPIYKEDGSVNMEASRRVSFRFMVDVEMA